MQLLIFVWKCVIIRQFVNFMIRGVLNRLKATLSVANQIDKWLFVPLGKVPVTISKWGRNTTQSDLLTLSRISD